MDNKRKKVDEIMTLFYSNHDLKMLDHRVRIVKVDDIEIDEKNKKINKLLKEKYRVEYMNNMLELTLSKLSEVQQEVIKLKYQNNYDAVVISEIVGITKEHVYTGTHDVIYKKIIPELKKKELI